MFDPHQWGKESFYDALGKISFYLFRGKGGCLIKHFIKSKYMYIEDQNINLQLFSVWKVFISGEKDLVIKLSSNNCMYIIFYIIDKAQKTEMEKREKERKDRTKVSISLILLLSIFSG